MTKPKIPQIRFRGFTEEWEEKVLENVVDVRSGRDYKHLSIGDIPVYGTGGYMLSVNQALSYNEDAIGIGRKGTIDKPYLLYAPFWTVDTLFYAVPLRNNEIKFLFCIFQKIDWRKKDESTGVPSLSKTAINGIEVYSPSHTEQTQIGNYFQKLDDLIAKTRNKLDKLKNMKQACLTGMFPQRGATTPQIRFRGFSDEWEEKKLGEIGSTFSGLSGKTKDDFGYGNAKYITYMNVFSNPITSESMVDAIEIDKKQNQVEYGDILFTVSSETPKEVGMSSVWLGKSENIYLNSFCFGYRLNEKVNPYYLAYYLRSPLPREAISILAQGISRYNISKNRVMEINLLFPDFTEQTQIGNFFKNLDNLIELHEKQLGKLQNIKASCLDKMFVNNR